MSSFKSSLFAALAAVVVTAGGLHYWQHRRNREAAWLRAANGRLQYQIYQRAQSRAWEKAKPPNIPAAAPGGIAAVAEDTSQEYRNEGQSTPLATLQTLAWTCDRGEKHAVERMLYFDEPARVKAGELMAALPDGIRAKWNSPEEMIADIITNFAIRRPFPSARILETASAEPINEERTRLRLPGTAYDRLEYQKTGAEWKLAVTEAIVERCAKALPGNQPTGR